MGRQHEIRDPIHIFIRLDSQERKVLDSRPLQRLRHIHQLALTYLVYPGATHRRFEHSLGVMELASRVYDIVTNRDNIHGDIGEIFPEDRLIVYWKDVLRMAALCHDAGHLPFSHAAEDELLPEGWNHERITANIIRSPELSSLWKNMKLEADDIVKLAVGPDKLSKFEPKLEYSTWESILSEIIIGDSFGVDRMDYLLRDSHHAGVAYGKFDHYRLIDTIRILPREYEESGEPCLGVEQGGLQSAESMLLARYFMYSQMYYHPVRMIYDIHLRDFLKEWLPENKFSTEINDHLQMDDNIVTRGFLESADNNGKLGHNPAQRIVNREHFKVLYERSPVDLKKNLKASEKIYEAAKEKFGEADVRRGHESKKGESIAFPVVSKAEERIVSSLELSKTLEDVPSVNVDYVFINPDKREEAKKWLEENREDIITREEEGE